eukprot:494624-Rhodomonas_salina.1
MRMERKSVQERRADDAASDCEGYADDDKEGRGDDDDTTEKEGGIVQQGVLEGGKSECPSRGGR